MNPSSTPHIYDRLTGWLLPLVAVTTPLIVVTPLRPDEQQAYYFVLITMLLTASLGLAWIAGWRRVPMRPTMPGWLVLALGLSVGISIAISGQYAFGLKKALLPAAGFLYFGLLVQHPQRRRVLMRATVGVAMLGVLLAGYGILQYFGIEFLPYTSKIFKNVVISTIGHPNYLGSVLGLLVFLMAGLTVRARGPLTRTLLMLGILMVVVCIALARTRAVWLGLIVGFGVLLPMGLRYCRLHRVPLRRVGRAIAVMLLQIGALALIVLVVLPMANRGFSISERLISSYEIKSRLYYWNAAIDMGREHPVFGVGFAMFDPNFWPYALTQQQSPTGPFYYDVLPAIAGASPEHVHNEYLEVFCEQGYAGLTALFAFLLFFFYFGYRGVMRIRDERRAWMLLSFYGALAMSCVDAFFGFPWRLPVSLMVFMIVLAWLYDAIDQPEPEELPLVPDSSALPDPVTP